MTTPVEIAKDVLKHIGHFKVADKTGYVLGEYEAGDSVLECTKSCTVCALGAMFLTHLDNTDSLKVTPTGWFRIESFDVYEQLSEVFTEEQLGLIEAAFECDWGCYYDDTWDIENGFPEDHPCFKAEAFGRSYTEPRERLVAIMENIIANEGTFKP